MVALSFLLKSKRIIRATPLILSQCFVNVAAVVLRPQLAKKGFCQLYDLVGITDRVYLGKVRGRNR